MYDKAKYEWNSQSPFNKFTSGFKSTLRLYEYEGTLVWALRKGWTKSYQVVWLSEFWGLVLFVLEIERTSACTPGFCTSKSTPCLEKLWTSTYALFVEKGVLVRLVYVMHQIKSAEEFCFQITCAHLYHGTVEKLASS